MPSTRNDEPRASRRRSEPARTRGRSGWCLRCGTGALAFLLTAGIGNAIAQTKTNAPALPPLELGEVLESVTTQYPPYLAALVERSIAEGRLRGAGGVYDPGIFSRLFATPRGYYESSTVETGVEQFLGLWGSTLYGGYRLTEGDRLPDYYPQRSRSDGDFRVGLRLPLLQDGSIDSRRAGLMRARLDRELADPLIFRQHLDFARAGTVAYYQWIVAGLRLRVAEDVLRLAQDRQDAIERQIARGLAAPIVSRENRQLVVSRELAAVRARRRLEASALALSLLFRNAQGQPVVPPRERLPAEPPSPEPPPPEPDPGQVAAALQRRPEIRQLELGRERLQIDQRLARNGLLPRLDASAETTQGVGDSRYADRAENEVKVGLEFRMPLRQSQARGSLQETQGRLEQVDRQLGFARDRIATEIQNAHQAVVAAQELLERAVLNVRLARELQDVERDRFQLGASDLLALQIREQAAYQARLDELDALEQALTARADLQAALALDLRPAR